MKMVRLTTYLYFIKGFNTPLLEVETLEHILKRDTRDKKEGLGKLERRYKVCRV